MFLVGQVNAQYYDLSVGTERHFYNCYGVTSNCPLPLPGEEFVGIERVTDEVTVDGKTWAVVTFTMWKDFFEIQPSYFTEENASAIENLYRMEGSVLLEYIDGNEVPIFDFEIDSDQPLSQHFAPFTITSPFALYPYNADNLGENFELSSEVLLDTTIEFPDMIQRRIIWADDPVESGFDVPENEVGSVFVNEILQEEMGTLKIRSTSSYTPYQPYFYVQGIGVMFTPVNHRGYIMAGYTSSEGESIGWQVPVAEDNTPEFNYPRHIGNVWVYEENWTPCIEEERCAKTRKELIDEFEVDGMSCSVFELSTSDGQNRREITWCFDDNKIYWPRTDIDPDTNRVDLVADFGQQVGHRWLLSNVIDTNFLYRVREIHDIDATRQTYYFADHGSDNMETLEGFVTPKHIGDDTFTIGDHFRFVNDVGLSSYGYACGGCNENYLKGSYINGELVGDTTFYYATSIDYEPGFPTEYELGAYPNPFNPTTKIRFELPIESQVELGVYTVTGRLITTLVSEVRPAGTHNVSFDASDLASGVYIYRIRAGDFTQTQKMTLIK